MNDRDDLLIRTLAHADAVRLPVRDWSGYASANRTLALPVLGTVGIPVRAGGGAADRKTGERLLSELEADGLIRVTRVGRIKFPHVRLTSASEARVRALCGLPGRAVARLILAAVADKTDRDPKTLARYWLPEIDLNRGRGWGGPTTSREDRRALSDIELDYLPAASAGWLVAGSDSAGRAYYALTAAGWSEIDRPTSDDASAEPEMDGAAELYRREQDFKLAALAATRPDRAGEIGEHPLPASMGGVPVREVRRRRA